MWIAHACKDFSDFRSPNKLVPIYFDLLLWENVRCILVLEFWLKIFSARVRPSDARRYRYGILKPFFILTAFTGTGHHQDAD